MGPAGLYRDAVQAQGGGVVVVRSMVRSPFGVVALAAGVVLAAGGCLRPSPHHSPHPVPTSTTAPPRTTTTTPAVDPCGAPIYDAVWNNGDTPAHSRLDIRCRDGWAVVDTFMGVPCPPGTPGDALYCTGAPIDRLYWEQVDGEWHEFLWDESAGCGRVLDARPAFPTELCADLGPLESPATT
jgi:hypothetical protein